MRDPRVIVEFASFIESIGLQVSTIEWVGSLHDASIELTWQEFITWIYDLECDGHIKTHRRQLRGWFFVGADWWIEWSERAGDFIKHRVPQRPSTLPTRPSGPATKLNVMWFKGHASADSEQFKANQPILFSSPVEIEGLQAYLVITRANGGPGVLVRADEATSRLRSERRGGKLVRWEYQTMATSRFLATPLGRDMRTRNLI